MSLLPVMFLSDHCVGVGCNVNVMLRFHRAQRLIDVYVLCHASSWTCHLADRHGPEAVMCIPVDERKYKAHCYVVTVYLSVRTHCYVVPVYLAL